MLLTLDVGNTNTVLGVFRGAELVAHWRLTTARDQTIDEYGILTRDLFTLANLEPREIGGVIISSVPRPSSRATRRTPLRSRPAVIPVKVSVAVEIFTCLPLKYVETSAKRRRIGSAPSAMN